MANDNNKQFSGPVAAQTVVETLVGNSAATRWIKKTVVLDTNGSTEVDIFGTTNGIAGTFIGMRSTAKDTSAGNITLQHTIAGTVVCSIAKGTSGGGVVGSAFPATAFAATGTATVKSSGGNSRVEIDFIVSHPALPGAQ
jgi:hypothetical protein